MKSKLGMYYVCGSCGEATKINNYVDLEMLNEENEKLAKAIDYAATELSNHSEFTKQHWVEELGRVAKGNQ